MTFIEDGLPVSVKLDAYDYSIFGVLPGTVTYISADTLTEEVKGAIITAIQPDCPTADTDVKVGDVVEFETERLGRLTIKVRDDLKRTWARETRLMRQEKGLEGMTPQLTGKYAKGA